MKNLLVILVIAIALITVIVFIVKNIITILAIISIIATIIGFFLFDSISNLEKMHNIKLVTKRQYKVILSSYITPMCLVRPYEHTSVSESFIAFIGFTPWVLVMLYVISQVGLKWNKFEELNKS